jgi:hypothetical protein
MPVVRAVAVALVLTALAAGCGDGDKEANGAACPAAPAALAGEPGTPSSFPKPSAVNYTATKKAGPSTIVTGYGAANVSELFKAYEKALGETPWAVTKSEHDAHDAEVAFAGQQTTGQVKLGEACRGRSTITITIRPA